MHYKAYSDLEYMDGHITVHVAFLYLLIISIALYTNISWYTISIKVAVVLAVLQIYYNQMHIVFPFWPYDT